MALRVAVGPADTEWFAPEAVAAAGATVVPLAEAEAILWMHWGDPPGLERAIAEAPGATWVQLPWAGVELYADAGVLTRHQHLTWTCGKGVYADEVAEHALALALACLRQLPEAARATSWGDRRVGRSLLGRHVAVVGAGGITTSLLRLLQPFGCRTTVLRRAAEPVPGADATLPVDRLADVLPSVDVLVLALALTPGSAGLVGEPELALLPPHAVLVNVARGAHVDTDALVAALAAGRLAGAGLDVTDPEPLPDGHPLFSAPGAVVTPHRANTPEMAKGPLRERIVENLRRRAAGEPLIGLVDPLAGY